MAENMLAYAFRVFHHINGNIKSRTRSTYTRFSVPNAPEWRCGAALRRVPAGAPVSTPSESRMWVDSPLGVLDLDLGSGPFVSLAEVKPGSNAPCNA